MHLWRPGMGFIQALAFGIYFVPIGGLFTKPEGAMDLNKFKTSGRSLKNEEQLNQVGSTSISNKLSAFAPEFLPSKISNQRSFPQTQHLGSNYPYGVKSNYGHSSQSAPGIARSDPGVMVPFHAPVFLQFDPQIPVFEMQQANFLEHINRSNKQILSQMEPTRQNSRSRKTRLSNMSDRVAESDVSLEHQTTDGLTGRSKHDVQVVNRETLPIEKDIQIQQKHQISVMENPNEMESESKKDSIRHSEPDLITSKEGTQKDGHCPQFVKVAGSSNIRNRNFDRLQNRLQPLKVRLEAVEEEEHSVGLSEQRPSIPIETQMEPRLDQGKIPSITMNQVLDPLKGQSGCEDRPLLESGEVVSIKTATPRGNQHEYHSNDKVQFDTPDAEIQGKMSKDAEDWIVPKKTVKNNQISKTILSHEDLMISELPNLHPESSSDPIQSSEALKTSSKNLQKSSKKHKKKKKSNTKASKVIDEDWDAELSKALKETSVSDSKIVTEHEKLIQNVQKRLQNIFVCDGNHKIDVPSTSSDPLYYRLIEQFLRLDNHTPLLELQMESETFKSLCAAEKDVPALYDTNFWLGVMNKILEDRPIWIEAPEMVRRQRAFLVQLILKRDSENVKANKESWSQEAREIASLLRYENPFEMFLDSTREEINVLGQHLDHRQGSAENELFSNLSEESHNNRVAMLSLRLQELGNRYPYGFFGKEFLEKASLQGLYMPQLRHFEIVLELSAPEVSWKGLNENELGAKFMQLLNILAGMPVTQPGPRSPMDREMYLYSEAADNWLSSHLRQLINNDPDLSKLVINRMKSLLLGLKGKGTRPLREICEDSKSRLYVGTGLNLPEELISRDEALAATFSGISLARLAQVKIWTRALDGNGQGSRRRFVHWPEVLKQSEEVIQAFRLYYELLGIKLLVKDQVPLASIRHEK